MSSVVVVDYGIGNLFSVRSALEYCGATVRVTEDPVEILSAPRLVLPGVGAFGDGMRGLTDRGLAATVKEFADSGRALLGICLGMQMLASASEEFGEHEGLGIIPGRVVPIPNTRKDGTPHKIPHIGWAPLAPPERTEWSGSILAGVDHGDSVYLVHSFAFMTDDEAHVLAECDYDGRRLTAAVRRGQVYGCQFHPEKSGSVGIQILSDFLSV
jgi:glutamine amidotransferase